MILLVNEPVLDRGSWTRATILTSKSSSSTTTSSRNIFLNKSENKFFLKKIISYNLKPKLKVTYLRSYFIYSKNVRITYDRNITYTLLDNLNIKNNNINDFMNVIEIKFKQKDLYIASSLIKKSKFVPKRFSKYLRGLYLSGISNYI